MKKRTISILLLMAILLASIPALASEPSRREDEPLSPVKYADITKITPSLSVSGSTATYSLSVKCPTDVTKICYL